MKATDQEIVIKFLNRGLPKWPQMIVTGQRLPEDLALEVIRRTDSWFVSGAGCNDRDGDRQLAERFRMPHYMDFAERPAGFDWRAYWERGERWRKAWGTVETQYVTNNWIGSAFIHGPHGWCHPDGQIYYVDNVGKWPSVEEIRDDWKLLAEAFPFLVLTVTLMSGEECEDDRRPVIAMDVAGGQVTLKEPNLGDHRPRRELLNSSTMAPLFLLQPALRERYPFSEAVMSAWEKKALEIDAAIAGPAKLLTYDEVPADEVPADEVSGVEFRPVTSEDTCMPWADFLGSCRAGTLTTYDGYGDLATDQQVSNIGIDSDTALDPTYVRPSWATHVCWYNK